MMISASSRARVLNGETTTWRSRLRNAIIEGLAYLISPLTPARMEYSVRTTSSRTPAIPDDRRYVGVATRCFSSQPDSEWLGPAWTISPCGAAQALASRVKVILHVVEERAPITVRGVCYALFVRERRQCSTSLASPSGL